MKTASPECRKFQEAILSGDPSVPGEVDSSHAQVCAECSRFVQDAERFDSVLKRHFDVEAFQPIPLTGMPWQMAAPAEAEHPSFMQQFLNVFLRPQPVFATAFLVLAGLVLISHFFSGPRNGSRPAPTFLAQNAREMVISLRAGTLSSRGTTTTPEEGIRINLHESLRMDGEGELTLPRGVFLKSRDAVFQLSSTGVRLDSGQMEFAVTEKGTPFQVHTPTIAVSVIGTVFSLIVSPEGDTTVEVLKGQVGVKFLSDGKAEETLSAGQSAQYASGRSAETGVLPAVAPFSPPASESQPVVNTGIASVSINTDPLAPEPATPADPVPTTIEGDPPAISSSSSPLDDLLKRGTW